MVKLVPKEESRIRLSPNGRWYHEDEPFENAKIIDFFHRAIRRDEKGHFYLHNTLGDKEEHVYFEVEDTAYFLTGIDLDPEHNELKVVLNTGKEQSVDPDALYEGDGEVMYCRLSGDVRARLTREALMQLADLSRTDEKGIYLLVGQRKVYLHEEKN